MPASTKTSSKSETTPGGEHLVQCIHIGRDPRHQAADGVLVVKADMHVLQMAEDLAAQVEHHHLSGPLHEVGLQVLKQEAESNQPNIDGSDFGDAHQRFFTEERIEKPRFFGRSQITVYLYGHQVRTEDVSSGLDQNGNQGNPHLPLVGPQIHQQPLHQPAVVRFT